MKDLAKRISVLEKIHGEPCGKKHEEATGNVPKCVLSCPLSAFNYLCAHQTFDPKRVDCWKEIEELAGVAFREDGELDAANIETQESRLLVTLLDQLKRSYELGILMGGGSAVHAIKQRTEMVYSEKFLEIAQPLSDFAESILKGAVVTREQVDFIVGEGERAIAKEMDRLKGRILVALRSSYGEIAATSQTASAI